MKVFWFLVGAVCGGVWVHVNHEPRVQTVQTVAFLDEVECDHCEAERLIESVDWEEC